MNDVFTPRYDSQGLLTAVAVDAADNRVLMVAFMDAEALAATRATGFAHFHSRSRGRLWKKGESSGNVLAVEEILIDCDQDALVLRCRPAGPACHTGADTCFFRRLEGDDLVVTDRQRLSKACAPNGFAQRPQRKQRPQSGFTAPQAGTAISRQ